MSNTVIKIENLYKEYKLGVISHGTLYRDLQSLFARVRGKEDPNSLISVKHHKNTEDGNFLALNDISLKINSGDRVGIIGKNGAGKSTLLKILSRITSPTKGEIRIKGRIGSLLEVGTGFHPELTGRENIYLNGSILGMRKWEIDKKLDEIVDFAGIEKHLDTPVKRYSSGMNVRLGFAVAAHLEPEILVVDEVLAVGDVEFQKKAIGKMEDVSKSDGRTILFVSHNMNSIQQLCDSCILLEKGKIDFIGSTSIAINKYIQKNIDNYKADLNNRDNKYYQEIVFKRIQLSNGLHETNVFRMGESLLITLDINLIPVDFHVSIIFWNMNDVKVAAINDLMFKNNIIDNRIVIKIPRILFTSGRYKISLSAWSRLSSMFYDVVDNAAFLTITDDDVYSTGEIVDFNKGVTYFEKLEII